MPYSITLVSHTHWDREWYQPFQEYRVRLCKLMDALLSLMQQDPEYLYFMLDGQTIALDDYLEIHPEREAEIRRLVQEGRLLIGPFHILPDEFLVSPEATIRNLLLGERMTRRFGAKMQIGYLPDPFGHVSQLPQILAGFGMDTAVFWRGAGDRPTEFLWEAPDGTKALVIYLRDSYGNAARLARDPDGFVADVREAAGSLIPHLSTSNILLMNGTDHMEPVPEIPALIRYANQNLDDLQIRHGTLAQHVAAVRAADPRLPTVRGEMRSPQLAPLLAGVFSSRMWIKQRNAACEHLLERWAEPFAAWAIAIGAGEDLGVRPMPLLWKAWEYLIQNHPHDSICGCSVDQVHREMKTRFAWAEQIGEDITRRSLDAISAHVNTLPPSSITLPRRRQHRDNALLQPAQCIPIVVFNPLNGPRSEVLTTVIQVPPEFGPFRLLDDRGREAPYCVLREGRPSRSELGLDAEDAIRQLLDANVERVAGQRVLGLRWSRADEAASLRVVVGQHARPPREELDRALNRLRELLSDPSIESWDLDVEVCPELELAFAASDLPPFGYRTYYLVPSEREAPTGEPDHSPNRIANEFYSVEADATDGTLTIRDILSGEVYAGLNRFVDGGDRGDEYTFCRPEQDVLVSAPADPADVRVTERSEVRQVMEISARYRVPARLQADRRLRSQETTDLRILTCIKLQTGVRRIDIETEVDNQAEDHRLRVLFPLPFDADNSYAEGHFDAVCRPIDLPSDSEGWAEQPVGTHHQRTFVDVRDERIGLLVANRGLPEYELLRENDRVTIALTLLRCTGWLSRQDLHCRPRHAGPGLATPGAQAKGSHRFDYALVPHGPDPIEAYSEAHGFNVPPQARVPDSHEGTLASTHSFLTVEPRGFVVSAIKWGESKDGLIVRGYNVTDGPLQARLHLHLPFRGASLARLDESEVEALVTESDGEVTLSARPKQVVTIKFLLDSDPAPA